MKPFDKEEMGRLIAAIHSLGKDKVRELALLMWQHIQEVDAEKVPSIPDCYVMVPKEPTKEMIDAGWLHFMNTKSPSSKGTYKAMLAAAPKPEK